MFLAINQIESNAKKRKKEKKKIASSNMMKPAGETDTTTGQTTATEMKMIAAAAQQCSRDNMFLDLIATTSTTPPTAALLEKCKTCQHALRHADADACAFAVAGASGGSVRYNADTVAHTKRYLNNRNQQEHSLLTHQSSTASSRVPCQCDCECVNKALIYNYEHKLPSSSIPLSSSPPPPSPPQLPLPKSTSLSSATLTSSHSKSTSLSMVYICIATLTLALATLAILFYSHVNSTSSLPPPSPSPSLSSSVPYAKETNFAFRQQFRHELVASEQLLRSIVAKIMQDNQFELDVPKAVAYNSAPIPPPTTITPKTGNLHYESTTQTTTTHTTPYDNNNNGVVRNERKYTGHTVNAEASTIKRIRRDISSSPSSMHADPFIEFFNPNHRKVLDEQDLEIRKRTGLKGAAPGGDEWIYLNTYCRVPEKIITGFCKGTQDYCPPGPVGPLGPIGPKGSIGSTGLPGIPGPKGNRGDVGLPGPAGVDGHPGPLGPRGPKGDIGIPGRAGLDGRDGVPGEPGLDGVPGRAGADGIPGKDGLAGRDGRDGINGNNGKDGSSGPKGAQGPPGERGLKGIAGPRGRPGKSGTNGTPGIPGINAWKVQLQNGSFASDLLIPPSIADLTAPYTQRTIIVEEGRTLNLSCAATGNPLPRVEWRRDDGRTINVQGVEMSSVSGQFLKFNNITRHQMAAYTCYADNGIPPVANATFLVEVHFAPMIAVYRQMIYAEYAKSATLECLVEAFPEAIRYWERSYDGKILDPGEKYRIETYPDGFKTTMRLTINSLRKDDFGYYHCIARNEINTTVVNFEIAPQDPNSETPYVGKEIKVYGQRAPESECPICDQCPDASLYQCKDSINNNFEIQPTGNYSYPGLPKRQKSCLLYAIGKPVFHKAVSEIYGCWMKDAAAKDIEREKTFITNENDFHNLFEFTSKTQYRLNSMSRKKFDISEGFHGNAHVVYNGSFYYNQRNSDLVVKLDLNTLKKTTTQLPYAGIAAGNKLYWTDYNYMDFNVDEVGLWVIYSTYDSNNTLVAKLDADSLKIQYNFNLTLDHRKFGEMFIVCGHLYAIDSCTDKNTQIRYAVDLYNGKLLNVNLFFSNPFRRTTSVGYNPLAVELYTSDKGNALTYPIRYHEQILNNEHA